MKNKFLGKSGVGITYKSIFNNIPNLLLKKFQIIVDHTDQFESLDENKIRIFWVHLTPEQNEEVARIIKSNPTPLANGGWKAFHKIVFISNHQMEEWINRYNIPRNYCTVIKYGISPVQIEKKPDDKIVLFHHPSPQRGLSILVDVFEELCKKYDNLELKVCSSYKIYHEENNNFLKIFNEKQIEYENSALYYKLENNSKIKNIGYLPNQKLRKELSSSHIFAYPSIMPETFCLSLLEAMSGGLLCVHSNYGCLSETASNWTMMYDFCEDITSHKIKFYKVLEKSILIVNEEKIKHHIKKQKKYVDYHFNYKKITQNWIDLLIDLKDSPPKSCKKSMVFQYLK